VCNQVPDLTEIFRPSLVRTSNSCHVLFFLHHLQDYMQNVHGKEIDLLRTTVKVPGKRPPRAVATVAPTASPKTNGLTKDRSALQLGIGNTGLNPLNM